MAYIFELDISVSLNLGDKGRHVGSYHLRKCNSLFVREQLQQLGYIGTALSNCLLIVRFPTVARRREIEMSLHLEWDQ